MSEALEEWRSDVQEIVEMMDKEDAELKRNGTLGIGWVLTCVVGHDAKAMFHLRLHGLERAQQPVPREYYSADIVSNQF